MIDKNHLRQFIECNDDNVLIDYRDKLYNNLQEIMRKEEKQTLLALVLVVLYFFVDYKSLTEISLGVITLTNPANLLIQLIPIIFCALLFSLNTIGKHRKDLRNAIMEISSKLSINLVDSKLENELIYNTLFRLYLPYSIGNFASITKAKRHIILSILGFLLLLPILVIGLMPFVIIFLMLSNLWQTQMETMLGIISFWLTFWISLSIIYFFFIPQRNSI